MGASRRAVALAFALVHLPGLVTADGECTDAVAGQLTWSCGGVCDEYVPCLVYNASDCEASSSEHKAGCSNDDDDVCAYVCFSGLDASSDAATLLIPFSANYESAEEVKERQELGDEAYDATIAAFENDTETYAWASNDALLSISTAGLDPLVTTLSLYGGSSAVYADFAPGKVVNVALVDGFAADNSNLSTVNLFSMNLQNVTDLPALLPTNVASLNLRNDVLTAFPYDAPDFQSVQVMDLSYNYMTNFSGYFASLWALYLNNNSFTAIPDNIFNLSTLQYLHFAGNPLEGMPTFTRTQVTFLQNLKELDLHVYDFTETPNCGNMANVVVHDIIVCVSDEDSGSNSESASADSSSGDQPTEDTGSSHSTGTVIGGVIGGAVACLLIGGLVWWCVVRRRRKNSTLSSQQRTLTGEMTPGSANGAHQYLWNDEQLQALRVDARDIKDVRKIGSGSFGVVWLVRYRSSQLLASKRPLGHTAGSGAGISIGRRAGGATSQQKQQVVLQRFVDEVKLVSQLDHINIVAFMGVAWTFHSDIQALFEYMENGDLRDYLAKTERASENSEEAERLSAEAFKLQIASDIIDALVYVHSFTPPIVHRDLKSRNVLLSSPDWRAKLTDFGAARVQSENHTMTAGVGTGRWLAPEVLAGSNDYGPPSDIFAFGVVLSELDTHAIPYDDARGADNGKPLANVAILQLVADGKLRPTFSELCRPALRELADRCMAQEPADRPTAAQIAYELRQVLKQVRLEQEQCAPRSSSNLPRTSSYRMV